MRLRIGTRVPHDIADLSRTDPPEIQRNRAVYRITEVIAETPWCGLYRGRKVFRNFDFGKRCLVEVEDDECLDVLLKTLAYPVIDQKDYVSARRDHAWFEAKKVLGCRKTNLIPEPLDFLEVRNDQDGFTFAQAGRSSVREPVMVCEFIYGENLARWRQRHSPHVGRSLHILAELLELMCVLHGQHVLMNNVSPAAFWADEMDRVHFVGTENVIDEAKAKTSRVLFPPERYARGFAAAELSEPDGAPSRESDLFGWGSLSYFLITGESPAALTVEQRSKTPRFGEQHREKLRNALASLDRTRLPEFKTLFGVEGSRFEKAWPDGFVEGLLSCLHEDKNIRPPDVASLRHWWQTAPPPQVLTAIGVMKHGRASLIFSAAGLASSLRFAIRRQYGGQPRSLDAGVHVWTGNSGAIVEDTPAGSSGSPNASTGATAWCYGVFSVDDRDGTTSVSRVKPITMLDGDASGYPLSIAVELARAADVEAAVTGNDLPPTLELLVQLEAPAWLATHLLGSQNEVVQAWAIEVLRRRLKGMPYDQECRALLLERGLRDVAERVRRKSAAAAVQTAVSRDLPFVLELASRLGGDAIEDRIRAARELASMGVPKVLAEQAVHSFELDRPIACQICGLSLRAGDLDHHLTGSHDYVAVNGKALPLNEGLKQLWSKLLKHFDSQAFVGLAGDFLRRHADGPAVALLESFRQQFQSLHDRRPSFTAPEHYWAGYFDQLSKCFHAHELGKHFCRLLLSDVDSRLRDLGRRYFLPSVAQMYSGDDADFNRFRRSIEFLVPNAPVGERIHACRLLENLGANAFVARQAEREFELDRLEPCPECGESIMRRELARHRRLRHGVFELDGVRHTWESLVAELVDRIFRDDANVFLAKTLAEVHQERFHNDAAGKLTQLLITKLNASDGELPEIDRVQGAACSLAPLAMAAAICHDALAVDDLGANAFGLMLFAHIRSCPDLDLMLAVAAMVGCVDIPIEPRILATEGLLRVGGDQTTVCRQALTELAQSTSGDALAKIDLLQSLKRRSGESPIVDDVCRELEESRRIRCTKCGEVFNGKEMAGHALQAHGLVFDGRSLRQPWVVAMECLDSFIATSSPSFLERGELLSQVGRSSSRRHLNFMREALRRGIDPGTYGKALAAAAVSSNESICPSCFAFVPNPSITPTPVFLEGTSELSSSYVGIRRIGDARLVFQYDLRIGDRPWAGRQPPTRPTRLGAVLAILGAFWISALIFALVAFLPTPGAMDFAKGSFVAGALGAVLALICYHPRWSSPLDLAWTFVVPELIKDGLDQHSTAFLKGLSVASIHRGAILARRQSLQQLIGHMKSTNSIEHLGATCLAEPLELLLNDLQATNVSPTDLLRFFASLIGDFVSGALPLSVLESVSASGERLSSLTLEIRVALRWRFFEAAYNRSWSVSDVIQLADKSTAIRTLLSADPPSTRGGISDAWAVLRASRQRNSLPPNAKLPIELIESGNLKPLRDVPELLLRSSDGRLYVYSGGLSIDGDCFPSPPVTSIAPVTQFVQTGWTYQRVDGGPDLRYNNNPPIGTNRVIGYDLSINGRKKRHDSNPEPFVRLIKSYSQFLFQNVRPSAAECAHLQPTGCASALLAPIPVSCAHCRQKLHFRAGEFAQSVSNAAVVQSRKGLQ
jgi:hypothetical protein